MDKGKCSEEHLRSYETGLPVTGSCWLTHSPCQLWEACACQLFALNLREEREHWISPYPSGNQRQIRTRSTQEVMEEVPGEVPSAEFGLTLSFTPALMCYCLGETCRDCSVSSQTCCIWWWPIPSLPVPPQYLPPPPRLSDFAYMLYPSSSTAMPAHEAPRGWLLSEYFLDTLHFLRAGWTPWESMVRPFSLVVHRQLSRLLHANIVHQSDATDISNAGEEPGKHSKSLFLPTIFFLLMFFSVSDRWAKSSQIHGKVLKFMNKNKNSSWSTLRLLFFNLLNW